MVDHSGETEPVPVQVLRDAGVEFRLHEHPAARNADELHLTGLSLEYSAKTLAFLLPDDRVLLAAIPGAARLRYPLLARAVGMPRSALRPAPPERLSALGMTPGGVTIFTRDRHAVVAVIHSRSPRRRGRSCRLARAFQNLLRQRLGHPHHRTEP